MMNANKETMLRRLQAADFVLHETVLYLDGHPTNQKALEFFRKAKTAYDELLAEFQQAFGPQTAYAADGSSPWEWVAPTTGPTIRGLGITSRRIEPCLCMRKSCNTR